MSLETHNNKTKMTVNLEKKIFDTLQAPDQSLKTSDWSYRTEYFFPKQNCSLSSWRKYTSIFLIRFPFSSTSSISASTICRNKQPALTVRDSASNNVNRDRTHHLDGNSGRSFLVSGKWKIWAGGEKREIKNTQILSGRHHSHLEKEMLHFDFLLFVYKQFQEVCFSIVKSAIVVHLRIQVFEFPGVVWCRKKSIKMYLRSFTRISNR